MLLLLYKFAWWLIHPLLAVLAIFNLPPGWHLRERLLFYRPPPKINSIWYHCASLGESKGLLGILRSLVTPDHHALITTATSQGRDFLKKSLETFPLKNSWSLHLAPLDHGPLLKRFKRNYNIACLILYEQELWPGVVDLFHRQNTPVILVSGRYTPQARKKYRLIRSLVHSTYNKLTWVQAQNEMERGNLNHILEKPSSRGFDFKLAHLLKNLDGDFKKLHADGFAFISLHRAELDLLLPVMIKISEQVPVFIFPRYMQDVDYFYNKLQLLDCVKWSESAVVPPIENLILVDAMGQILKQARYYNMCFVGGSLVNAGGHNVWEPFLEGIKIIIGPYHYNQYYAVLHLKARELLSVIEKPEELLAITYEPYNLEASSEIIQGLKQEYKASIGQIAENLKPIANKISIQAPMD